MNSPPMVDGFPIAWRTKVSTNSAGNSLRVTIPAAIVKLMRLTASDEVEFRVERSGRVTLRRKAPEKTAKPSP